MYTAAKTTALSAPLSHVPGRLKVNPADDLNLENQWLELYQGIMVSGSFQYKKLGSFLAYDKDDNNEYSIIDKKAVFNETAPVDEVTYPTTPLQLAQWGMRKSRNISGRQLHFRTPLYRYRRLSALEKSLCMPTSL